MSFIKADNPSRQLPFCPECGYQMVEPEPNQFLCLSCRSTKRPDFVGIDDILNGETYHDILQYEQQLQAHGVPANLINDFENTILENAAKRAVAWCNDHHCAHSKGEDDVTHAIMGR